MQVLTGTMRAYPWGSRTAIAGLRGQETPSSRPQAELWFGAHPTGSSLIGETPLVDIINEDPEAQLGARVRAKYGDRLPFLLKLLAAEEPLSLQAHPSKKQAEEGFKRDNEAGIGLTDPNRNYKDDNHKPELIVALTPFEAMAGFRPIPKTLLLFDALDCPALDHYRSQLLGDEEAALRSLFTTWIGAPIATRSQLIAALVQSAKRLLDNPDQYDAWIVDTIRNIVKLNERYPDDIGILGALLLNKVNLQPGEALYLDAGQLHAYVRGLGVEIMANSDNVLRGGLTSKHVDVPELARVLRFESNNDPRVVAEKEGDKVQYPVPIDEFNLSRYRIENPVDINHDGPQILLCTEGSIDVKNSFTGESLTIKQGDAIWVSASDPSLIVASTCEEKAAEFFVACV